MGFPASQRESKGVGLKKQRLLFLIGLITVAMFPVCGLDGGAYGQSQSDVKPQSEKGGQATPDETPVLKTQKDQVNYAIGVHLIGNFKRQGVDIDLDLVIKGMRDAYSGKSYS